MSACMANSQMAQKHTRAHTHNARERTCTASGRQDMKAMHKKNAMQFKTKSFWKLVLMRISYLFYYNWTLAFWHQVNNGQPCIWNIFWIFVWVTECFSQMGPTKNQPWKYWLILTILSPRFQRNRSVFPHTHDFFFYFKYGRLLDPLILELDFMCKHIEMYNSDMKCIYNNDYKQPQGIENETHSPALIWDNSLTLKIKKHKKSGKKQSDNKE